MPAILYMLTVLFRSQLDLLDVSEGDDGLSAKGSDLFDTFIVCILPWADRWR